MEKLNSGQWANIYSKEKIEQYYQNILDRKFSAQTLEMLRIVKGKKLKLLEIGCGSGQTAIALAIYGQDVTALDYQVGSLDIVQELSLKLEVEEKIKTLCIDASKEFPFNKNEFDIIYHAGLLEHFEKNERIELLANWKKYCKEMISMVPNGASLGYRIGKAELQKKGKWTYGKENVIFSQIDDFYKAGICMQEEYTIGIMNSFNFLDEDNEYRKILTKLWESNLLPDYCHQGYLLVTRGMCSNE